MLNQSIADFSDSANKNQLLTLREINLTKYNSYVYVSLWGGGGEIRFFNHKVFLKTVTLNKLNIFKLESPNNQLW